MTRAGSSVAFRVTFVDGVTLDKWRRRWAERQPATPLVLSLVDDTAQVEAVRSGAAAMAFVRDLTEEQRQGLHHIALYDEITVVVVGIEHPAAAYDEIPLDDLRDEIVLDDPALSTRLKVETVAAGTGIVLMPMSVARAHHRKDVVAVPVVDASTTTVGLAWRTDLDDPLTEALIGIVRGRTANSSRGDGPPQPPAKASPPRPPGQKSARRQPPRRGAAGPRRSGGRRGRR